MSIEIRKMKKEDISELVQLEKECFSTPWSEASLSAELEKDDSYFFVLFSDDALAGYIGSNIILEECYIANVAVFEKYRRSGFGKQLVDYAVNNANNMHCSFITLEVRLSNIPAIELYKSFGFEECGRRKNFYSSPVEDCLIMTKYFNA